MNLANKLTLSRILLVPVYALVFLYTDWKLAALILFIGAALTDFVDGYVARNYKMVTDLGKFMDPLADKLLTLTAFILFTHFGYLNPLWVIIIIAREVIVSVFRAVAASKQVVIAASVYGKIKTVLQFSTIIMVHLYLILNRPFDLLYWILVGAMVIMTLISGVDYVYKNKKVLMEQ